MANFKIKGIGSLCQQQSDDSSNDECSKREPNTVCIESACVCEEKYIEQDGHCKPGEKNINFYLHKLCLSLSAILQYVGYRNEKLVWGSWHDMVLYKF